MKTEYRVIKERLFRRELGSYRSFSILGVSMDGHLVYIPDVSTLEYKVAALVERLNRLEVSRHHLMDVVLDSLAN